MFDTTTQRYVAIDGEQRDTFEKAKYEDGLNLLWYSKNTRSANEEHIANCHTCQSVRTMYEDAYAEQVTRGLQEANPLSAFERDLANASPDELRSRVRLFEKLNANQAEQLQEFYRKERQLEAPIQASDKRLWPIFAKAARIANQEGYCSEYDRVSEAAGIPSRDELTEAGYLTSTYEVRTLVTFTLSVIVDADSEDDAISKVDYMDPSELMEHLSLGDVDAEDIDNHDARQAERIEE